MQERDYQVLGIQQTIDQVSTMRKVVRQLPTGGGKTVEFAMLSKKYIENTGKSVLILVHRQELMYQAQKTIKEVCNINACLITSETKQFFISRVYIGMVESTVSRLNCFDNVGLVIIDECHIANFNKVHSIFLEELIIGYSATPISSNKRMPLKNFYHCIILGPQINQLIQHGFLCQNITKSPREVVDVTKFEIDKLKGDYNEKQMSTEYKLPKFVLNTVKHYKNWCRGKKTLIFNTSIEHSNQVNLAFQTWGFNCRHLASDNEHERVEILEWFRTTPDAILCNVGIATMGYDEPTVQEVILNFATLSLMKYIQCCGRGSRPIDGDWIVKNQHRYPYELQQKYEFGIHDLGGNHVRFRDWNEDRDWQRLFDYPERVFDGVAPMKTCPDCESLVHAAIRICPMKLRNGDPCLHEFLRKKTPEEMLSGEVDIITKGMSLDQLIKKNAKKFEYYTFFELAQDVVDNMFRQNSNPNEHLKQKSFDKYFDLCKTWYNKTLANKPGYMSDITDSGWHIRRAKNHFEDLINKKKGIRKPAMVIPIEGVQQEIDLNSAPLLLSRQYIPKDEDNVFEW